MNYEVEGYGYDPESFGSGFSSYGSGPSEPIPVDRTSAVGIMRSDLWRNGSPEQRAASVDLAFTRIIETSEKDKARKVAFGDKEVPLFTPDGGWSQSGKEWLQQQRSLLEAAAQDESGGVVFNEFSQDVEVAPHLASFLEKPKKQHDPFSKLGEIRREVEGEIVDGKPRELTWEEFVARANQGKDPDSPAAIDPDNEAMRKQFESRKKLDVFNPDTMGDKVFEMVEGVPVFNPKALSKPSQIEKAIEDSKLSVADKKMALINLRDTYNRLDSNIISQAADADAMQVHKFPLEAGAAILGIETNDLHKRFADHMAKPEGSMYSFIKENEAEFSDEKYGWADKLNNAFWNANRSTGAGALWLLTGGKSESVNQFLSDSARANDSAFEGMGGIENYRVLGMDFTNKGMYDMAGQVMSILATGGGGALLKGGVKGLGMAAGAEAGAAAVPKAGIAGAMAKGILNSEAKILNATRALAPNTAKNLAIKALRDPSAYIGSLQASGMSFGSTFNEVMDQTGDYETALKKANIQAISDGLSAFIATSVFNRIAPGAEKMLSGVEGSMSGSLLARMQYAKAAGAAAGKEKALDVLKDVVGDEALRKSIAKGLAETVDIGAKRAGLKGFGVAAGMTSEFFEEATDTAISDVFQAMLDDSKTWTDSVWNNIGAKFSEYMAAGVMGAFGGGLGESVGGLSNFSKKSREKRAEAVNYYAETVWEKIKGNVESFDPVTLQVAQESGVDKNIVTWAEYFANSPDSPQVKAKKFADQVMSGAYTADYTMAPDDEPENATVAGDATPAIPKPANASATAPSASSDEGVTILEKVGVSVPAGRSIKAGLSVQRDSKPIKIGKAGTLTPIRIGSEPNAAAEWTPAGGEPELVSAQRAAQILNENKSSFTFKRGINQQIQSFTKAQSRYEAATRHEWTTKQSEASDGDSGKEPAPGKEGSGDSNAAKADGGGGVAVNGQTESARSEPAGSSPAPALTQMQEAINKVAEMEDEELFAESTKPLSTSNNFIKIAAIDRLKSEKRWDEANRKPLALAKQSQSSSPKGGPPVSDDASLESGGSAAVKPLAAESSSPSTTEGKTKPETNKTDGLQNESEGQRQGQGLQVAPLADGAAHAVEGSKPSAAPVPDVMRENTILRAAMTPLQSKSPDELLDIVKAGLPEKNNSGAMRWHAARKMLINATGIDPVEQVGYTILNAAAPTATKAPKTSGEIVTFTVDRNLAIGGTDRLGGVWSSAKTSGKGGAETFYYTPPKGQKMRGNPSVLSFTDTENEVLVLAGIKDGRYMFKRINLGQALENQSNKLDQPNFDRASREWESTRLTASNKAIIASLSKILGAATVSQAEFNKVFNAVLRIVAPNVNAKAITFTSLPGDSFIRTEDGPKGPKVVVDKDKMVGHLRLLFDGYVAGRGDFYDTMVANEMARQLAGWIDEEQIHRIALPLFTNDELQKFFDESLAAEGDAKSIRNLLLNTIDERLPGAKSDELSPEQIRMVVHETLRKMHQLISTGSNTEMQTESARTVMAILNEEASKKGVFNKIKTVMAMMRRYFHRVKNALYMRRLHRKMTGEQQKMLNRLMSAYSKENLQGDVDMISQKASDHASWIYKEWQKDFEQRTNSLIMSEDLSDALTALKDVPKRFVNVGIEDLVLLDSKTGKLTVSDILKGMVEDGWISSPIESIEKALNMLTENNTGFDALTQLVMAEQALEAARFNVDDVRGLDLDNPSSTAVWNALAEGIRMSGDVAALSAIQNHFAEQRAEVKREYRQKLAEVDINVIRQVRDANLQTQNGLAAVMRIAVKTGASPNPSESHAGDLEAWRSSIITRLINSFERGSDIIRSAYPLATAKIKADTEAKLSKINDLMAEQEKAYQESVADLPKRKPMSEEAQDKYIRYTSYLQALDEYNKAARNVVKRAIGEFDYRNKDHGLSFKDVSNAMDIPAPTYGFKDVDGDSPSEVNGYHYFTAEETAEITSIVRAGQPIPLKYERFLYDGYPRPSRRRSPELYSTVSSNAGHQGKVMFERFHILQSQGVVPMSDVYTLTGGFNIPVETSEMGGSKVPQPGEIFYRWKADEGLAVQDRYIKGDYRNKVYPNAAQVMEAIGHDRDLAKKTNTYTDHLNYSEEWLDAMEALVAPGMIVEEIGGTQTLAGRQAVLLRRRLFEARVYFERHRADIEDLYEKARNGFANVGQELDGLLGGQNENTKLFREAMWNASADVMIARTAYRAFMDPQWRSNVRREASRTTRDAGFRPNVEYKALRDRPIDMPTYVNYSWFLNHLSQRNSEYFVSPVYASDLLRNLEKGNWSNDSYEMWKESQTKWKRVISRDQDGNPIKGADGQNAMEWVQVTQKSDNEGLVFPQSQLDADGRPLMPPSMMETSPFEEDETQAKAERKKDAPDMIRRRWFTQTALLVGMRIRSDKTREKGMADTEKAQQFFHDISSLGEGSDVGSIVKRGISGLFGLYDSGSNRLQVDVIKDLIYEFQSRYKVQTNDPIELLADMVRFKAEKEQALLDQARIENPDIAMQALVTLIGEATAGGRNQDMMGKSSRPMMDGNSYVEAPVVGEPITQEVDEAYDETVPDPEGPFGGETKKVTKTRNKTVVTGNVAPEGEFSELDKFYREKTGRSLFDQDGSNPNEFITEDEIAEITRQFRRDMLVTSGKLPAFRASVLKQDGGEHPFVSSNRTVNLLMQSLPGDVIIYAPQRSVYANSREVKTRIIPGRNGGPTVLYVRPGANTGRDEAAALIASSLSIHAANSPTINQIILDFAKDGMEKISVMRSVERIDRAVNQRAKLYHALSKKIGDKILGGKKVDVMLRESMEKSIRDHLIRLARHAQVRGSLSEASIYDKNGNQSINGSIIFISELMTDSKLKELYDLMTPDDGLAQVPDTGLSSESLIEILQAVEDVTRSNFADQENQAAQYEHDALDDSAIEYSEEDFAQEGDDFLDENLGLELQEAAEADPDIADVMAQGLANLGKESGESEVDPLAPANAAKTGLVESKRKIDALIRTIFRDESIHLRPSPTLAKLVQQARSFGNTGLHRSDAEVVSFMSRLLSQANQKVAPFDGRQDRDYSLDTREQRLEVMSKIAGIETYGKALASATLPATNRLGSYYGGSWGQLLRPDNPSRSSLMTTAMNANRMNTMQAGLLGETLDVQTEMERLIQKREEEINDSWNRATKNKPGLSGYGQQNIYQQASDSLVAQLGYVLPSKWETVDGVRLNRVQLAQRDQERVIDSIFERKAESERKLREAREARANLESGELSDEDFNLLEAPDVSEETVGEIVDNLVSALDDVVRGRVLARRSRAEDVAATFRRLSANTYWQARRNELQDEINQLDRDVGAYRRSDDRIDMPILAKAKASWLNKLIDRFEEEVNDSLNYILKEHYGVAPVSQEGKRRRLFQMDRVDMVDYSNLGTLLADVNAVFNADALSREIGSSMASLDRGVIGDEFVDVLLGGVQKAEEKLSSTNAKAKRLSTGKQTKPRQGESLNTNAKKQLDSLLRDLQERFEGNPDRTEARAYIKQMIEQGFSREDALNLPADIVEDNKLLSSAIRALIPSMDMRYRMLTDTGKLSTEVRDKVEKTYQQEIVAQRELLQAEEEIARLMARSVLPQEVGWTKRMGQDPKALDASGMRPEMSFTVHLVPPGLSLTPEMTPTEVAKAKKDFAMAKSREMLEQIERGERPDFSYVARVNAIMRETGHVARHEMDDAYRLLKADSQYFNDFNPQLLIQNTLEQVKAEKAMIEARIQQARDIAKEVAPTGGLNSLGMDALTMLSDPANDVQIVSVNAKKRVSTWTAPSNWQARRDLLGRLVNDEGQWIVLAPTTAREDLAKRYADTGRPKVTFENFVLDALAPTLTGKDYEGNRVSRINFSSSYLDEETELDLPVVVDGKVVTTKGMTRREAGRLIEREYRINALKLVEQSSNREGYVPKDGHKVQDNRYVKEALDRFGYMIRSMVYAHNHSGLTTDVKVALNDWLRKLQDSSKGDHHFRDMLTVQEMNAIEMFSNVFADIEGGYIMDTLASGLAMNPQAHNLTMMKYLHHEDGRTRSRFIRSYVAMQEAMRIRSLLDRGFDDESGRIGAKVQHQKATEALLLTQKALGNDALVQSKAYVHASLQGILSTRSGSVGGNLSRWIDDFEKGVFYLEGLDSAQRHKFKSAGSRFFNAMHVDLLRDMEMVKEIKSLLESHMRNYSEGNGDLTFESREALAKQVIARMQDQLTKDGKKPEIEAHSKALVDMFDSLTDAMQVTKMLMSQPEETPSADDELNPLYHKGKRPGSFFNTTVPLRFHYASNPLDSEIDKASYEEGNRKEDPIDIVKLEESTLFGGMGRHEREKGRNPYRPINLNGLSAIDSILDDAFYRLNVTPAYTVLRKVIGREEPTKQGITMVSEDAKILKPINQTLDWKYEKRAERAALAAVARELENVIANDSQMGTYNTQFSEAARFLSSMFTVKALVSVLQLWNQTAPASLVMIMKKVLTGDIQSAKNFMRIASRMGASGVMGNIKGAIQTADEKSTSGFFFKKVDEWVKEVDPWISFRGTDGMDPYRNVLRAQVRHGINPVKAVAGKVAKQIEALGEWGLDRTIGVGERWIARSIYMTELLGELQRMKDAGVIDSAPVDVDQLLEIPGSLIPTQAKDYARMKVNDMMGIADQSKKSFMFQSHSRFPGVQAITRSAVRFSNHTATTASNMTALLPAIKRLGDDASYGEQRMRREAAENVIGTLGQNTLFHFMKFHTLIPLLAYIIFNSAGDDDDEAQRKAQEFADGILAPNEEMDKVSDYVKGFVFGKENQLFQDWRDPESARRSAYANLLGKTFTEFAQAIPVAGVAFGYMPVNSASKSITDPIAENLMAIGDDMEVARVNMAENGVRIYDRQRGPIEGIANLTTPSAELYNLFDAGRTAVNSMFLDDTNPLETAAYLLTEVFATREIRGMLEGDLKKKIRDAE